jgi:hypothetical protein
MTAWEIYIHPQSVARMARAICDADPTLEDMKHGYKCASYGCQEGNGACVAFRQAKAAARALERVTRHAREKDVAA